MMNVTTLKSASGAAKYYAGYYEQGELSQWYGKGAKMLGLKGEIKQADFLALLEGKLPDGQELGRHGKNGWEHRPGYDLPASAPKSFSVMMLGDKELINLHIKAVTKTIDFIQSEYSFARNKVKGKNEPVQTNNLTAGMFTQFFSRDLDMQLHTHIILMNATHDGEKFKALFSDTFSNDIKYLGLVYRNYLAELVQQRGYEIVETGKEGFWEFKDIPKSVNDQFSKRRKSIEKYAKDMQDAGILNVDMQIANKATRQKKDESAGYDALIENLKQELNEKTSISMADIDRFVDKALSRGAIDINDEKHLTVKAVDKAVNHLMCYADIWTKDRLVKQARAYGIGLDIGLIKHEIEERLGKGFLVGGKDNNVMSSITHEQIQQNIDLMRNGRLGKISFKFFAKIASLGMLENSTPSKKEQLVSLLTTKSQYVALNSNDKDGYDILKAFGTIIRNSRYYNVTAVIPTALSKQSFGERQQLLGTKGVYTLSGLTKYWGKQFAEGARLPSAGQQIFVVDKAHLFNTEGINEIMTLADKLGAKVVFNVKESLGKLKNQLGGCNVLLGKGMESIGEVDTKSLEDRIKVLDDSNRINVIKDYDSQFDRIKNICQTIKSVPQVVVPTKSLKVLLNEEIRNGFVESGRISTDSIQVDILDKAPMSDVDRRHIQFYQTGYIIRGDGQYYEVKDVDRDVNVLKLVNLATKEFKEWNLNNRGFKSIDVYQQRSLSIAKGDNLVWTRTVTIDGEKRRRNCLIEVLDVNDRSNIKARDNFGKEFIINPTDLKQQHFNRAYVRTIQESLYKDSKIDVLYCPSGKIDSIKAHTCLEMLSRRGQVVVSDIGSLGGTKVKSLDVEKERSISQRDGRDIVADNAVVHGMIKLSERDAVFSLKNLKKEALEYCGSRVGIDDIDNAIDRSFDNKELVDTKADDNKLVRDDAILLTTKETINIESRCIKLMQESKDCFEPILANNHPLIKTIHSNTFFNKAQKEAIEFIVTQKDGIFAVQGIAGSGKTSMMKEVVRIYDEVGVNVVGIVNTTSGRGELGRELKGVASEIGVEALTVKALLNQVRKLKDMKEFPRTLFILDESSLVSNKEMLALEQLCKELGQQLLVVGDFQQNKSIGAGHPYKLLLKNGMEFKTLDTNVRLDVKRTLDAAKAIYQGDVVNALNNIRIEQIPDRGIAIKKLADEYLASIKDSPGSGRTGIAHSNKDRVEVNNTIRSQLKKDGLLEGKSLSAQILVPRKDLLETDKTRAVSYEEGDVIKFSNGYRTDISKGEYCKVLRYEANSKTVVVKSLGSGKEIDWTPNLQSNPERVEVFKPSERSDLMTNDSIIWRATDGKRGIINGEVATVVGVNPKDKQFSVKLANGEALTLDATDCKNQHWDYSYTVTSYMIQGRNIRDNLFYINSNAANVSIDELLVAITRGDNVQIVTDDALKLAKKFEQQVGLPETALELIQDGWGKEFENKFRPNIKGDASKAPGNVFTGEFDVLKKTEKVNEYLEASKLAGREYFSHKQRVNSVGYEIAEMIKDKSVASLEKRNELAHGIFQNISEYQRVLEDNGLDVKKIKTQALKHQEKLEIDKSLSENDARLQSNVKSDVKSNGKPKSDRYVDKDVVIDKLHSDIDGFARDLLGEPDKVTNNTLYWGRKGSMQVHINGSKLGYWMDWEQGNGGRDMLSLYLQKTGQNFKEGIHRLSKDFNLINISALNEPQRTMQQQQRQEKIKIDKIQEQQKQSQRIKWANDLYRASKPLKGTLAETYLRQHRGVKCPLPEWFGFHPSIKHKELNKNIPAMTVPIQDCNGDFKGIVRIYLEQDGSKLNQEITDKNGKTVQALTKADLGQKQRNFALINRGKNNEKVYLAEGVETAFSLVGSCRENTILAVLAVNNFKTVELFKETKEVVICADRDGVNSQAHKTLLQAVEHFKDMGIKVSVVMPEISSIEQKLDFNDLLMSKGQGAVTRCLNNPIDINKEFRVDERAAMEIKNKKDQNKIWRVKEADKLYSNSMSVKGTIGEKYFKDIDSAIPSHFRFLASISHPQLKDKYLSAVIAPVQDNKGNFKGVTKIYLENNGNKLDKYIKDESGKNVKVDSHVTLAKKTGNFVLINIGKDNKNLYLTNSPEDGLSIMAHCKDNTVLSVLSLQNFKEIKPFRDTKEIIICASRDDVTKNSNIVQAVEHFKDKGLDVSIRIPEASNDKSLSFQNLLQEHGRDAVSDSLNKPMDVNNSFDNIVAISSKGDNISKDDISVQKQPKSVKQENVVQQRQIDVDRQMMR